MLEYNLAENIKYCAEYVGGLKEILLYSHIGTAVFTLLLGFFIFLKDRKSLLAKIIFSLSLAFSIWSFLDLNIWFQYISGSKLMAAWAPIETVSVLIFLLVFYFVYVFSTNKDLEKRYKAFLVIIYAPVFLLANSQFNITAYNIEECTAVEKNLYADYVSVLKIILMVLTAGFLVFHYRKAEAKEKFQTKVLSLGLVSFIGSFYIAGFISDLTGNYTYEQYGLFGILIFIGVIAFLIVRYKIFNIKLFGAQVLVITLSLIVAFQFFFIQDTASQILNTFNLLLSISFGYFLIKSVAKEIKTREQLQDLTTNLEKTNARLRELDQQKSEFISLASHQLRGPLTAVKGYASLILEGDFGNLSPEVREAVETMYKSTQALVVLVGDYLDVSRIEQGRMKYDFSDFNLKELTESVIHELMPTVEMASLKLSFDFDNTKEYMVHADQGKIKQVISNLIDNATKYTKQGGIHVHIERNHRDNLLISIKDTGIGIPAEVMPRLFEKFIRAPEAGKANIMGTGLGLYVAKKIIEAQRGKIWAESPGKEKGSTFYIELEALHATPKPGIEAMV